MKTYRGAGIAFFRQKNGRYEVFLGRRKYGAGKGKWSFPGGGMDARDGGDFLSTAKRETREEMGVDVDRLAARRVGSNPHNLFLYQWETFFYLLNAPEIGDGFRFVHEMYEWKWFPFSDLDGMQARNELFDVMGVSVVSAVEKFKKFLA